uniref:Uncharacterized protein n=1 Tax=Eutreptiella gymnastica TaxID=73025 RepID=A0A7S4FUI5_9EUGL
MGLRANPFAHQPCVKRSTDSLAAPSVQGGLVWVQSPPICKTASQQFMNTINLPPKDTNVLLRMPNSSHHKISPPKTSSLSSTLRKQTVIFTQTPTALFATDPIPGNLRGVRSLPHNAQYTVVQWYSVADFKDASCKHLISFKCWNGSPTAPPKILQ